MPSESHHRIYQQFEQLLHQIQATLADQSLTVADLKAAITHLQQVFQTQVVTETPMGDEANPIQAIQTEMNKQLRLLDTDILFLQAARQPGTTHQRKQQIADRLNLLLSYCAAVLNADS